MPLGRAFVTTLLSLSSFLNQCGENTYQPKNRQTSPAHQSSEAQDGGLPVLAIKCRGNGEEIGTGFVVRVASQRNTEAIVVTAAHVVQRDARICDAEGGLELQGRPYEGDRNIPCKYGIATSNWPLKNSVERSSAVEDLSFPLDIGTLLVQPSTEDGRCRLRSSVQLLLSTPDSTTPIIYRLLGRRGSGTLGIDLTRPQYVDVESSPDEDDSLDGLDLVVTSGRVRVGPGYSGSPVLFFVANRFLAPAIVTDQAALIGREEQPETAPDVYSSRLLDSIGLPPTASDALRNLVPPSSAGRTIIDALSSCQTVGAEKLKNAQLDGFDELHILATVTTETPSCGRSKTEQQEDEVLKYLRKRYSSSVFDWPGFSISVAANLDPTTTENIRRKCNKGEFEDPDSGMDVWQLQAMALGMHYKIFGDKLGETQAFSFIRDKAKCQSWLTYSYRYPSSVLRNVWFEDMFGQLRPSALRFYADLLKDMDTRTRVVTQKYGEPNVGDRTRIAAIAFRLYELCYRTEHCVSNFADVAAAARRLDKITDGGVSERLSSHLPFEKALANGLSCFPDHTLRRPWSTLYDTVDGDERVLRNIERRVGGIARLRSFQDIYGSCRRA